MRRLPTLLSLLVCAPLVLSACFTKDDEDDEDDPEADNDGDGLTNAEEDELGTDPDEEDSDGDGWEDGEEVDAETDPLDPFSWEFGTDRWPDFTDEADDDDVDGDTWDYDEVFPNFATTDQFGNDIELYQFYGYVILIDFSAGWCGPCRAEAEHAEELWEDYREDGFMVIHAMVDDNSGSGYPDQDFLESWVEDYDIEFPVLAGGLDTDVYNGAYAELYYSGINQGYIPFMILLDQDMRLVTDFTGSGLEDDIRDEVEGLLDL